MFREILNNPGVRNIIDNLPADNIFIQYFRAIAKALVFGKGFFKVNRISFVGIKDSVFEQVLLMGPDKNEVLVSTSYTAVSPGTEKAYYLDDPNFHQPRPFIPGYSGCGVINGGVKASANFKKGDRVRWDYEAFQPEYYWH